MRLISQIRRGDLHSLDEMELKNALKKEQLVQEIQAYQLGYTETHENAPSLVDAEHQAKRLNKITKIVQLATRYELLQFIMR